MEITFQADPLPLRKDAAGTLRVGASRVLLELVIHAFQDGATPEAIVQRYPTTTLADVYAVIAWYLRHRTEAETYLAERAQQAADVRRQIPEPPHSVVDLRNRLLALRMQPEPTASNPSRRAFLRTATNGAAALLASGNFAYAGGHTPPRLPLTGHGEHTYTMDHHWAKLPAGKRFGYTHGIVEDRQGRFYIANQSRDAMVVLDAEGNYLSSWGQAYAKGAHGLHLAAEGDADVLYLANTGLAEVVKTTLEGDVVWKAGRPYHPAYTQDKPYSPTETALGPNGLLYVADGYGQSWIHVYDAKDGRYLDAFGGPGPWRHHLNSPHGISIDTRSGTPVVQVSDRNNVRIVHFSLEGQYLGQVISRKDLRFPCTTFHRHDLLYIPDLFARVSLFDREHRKIVDLGDYVDGQELTSWGDFGNKFPDLKGYPNIPHAKRTANKFISPHALWVDQRGNIYVVEWIEDGRLTRLTKQE